MLQVIQSHGHFFMLFPHQFFSCSICLETAYLLFSHSIDSHSSKINCYDLTKFFWQSYILWKCTIKSTDHQLIYITVVPAQVSHILGTWNYRIAIFFHFQEHSLDLLYGLPWFILSHFHLHEATVNLFFFK